MSLKSILQPTKAKITIDILISILLIAFSISLPQLGIQQVFLKLTSIEKFFNTLMGLIFTLIIYYPLTCGLLHLYKIITREKHPYRKPESINKTDLSWAILFLMLLNPISISAIYSASLYINNKVIQEPCGLLIERFTDNSEAEKAGIKPGEKILEVDNIQIKTKEDLLTILSKQLPSQYAMVKTNIEDYRVRITQNAITKKNILGIVVKEIYCKRLPKLNN